MRTYGYESTLTICPRQAEIEKKVINVRVFVISKYDYAVKNVWSENDKSKTKQLLTVIKMQIITNLQWFMVKQPVSSYLKLLRW